MLYKKVDHLEKKQEQIASTPLSKEELLLSDSSLTILLRAEYIIKKRRRRLLHNPHPLQHDSTGRLRLTDNIVESHHHPRHIYQRLLALQRLPKRRHVGTQGNPSLRTYLFNKKDPLFFSCLDDNVTSFRAFINQESLYDWLDIAAYVGSYKLVTYLIEEKHLKPNQDTLKNAACFGNQN